MLYTSIALAIASIYHSQQRQRRMRLQLERILRRMAHRTRLAAITMNVLATQESHDRKSPREKPRSRGKWRGSTIAGYLRGDDQLGRNEQTYLENFRMLIAGPQV